jgi:magnesium-transporting ATPase (P-type)
MQLDDGEAFVADDAGGLPRRIHPRELRPGMRIVIYPGARVPADGMVIEGSIAVDEKAITGESVPRDRIERATAALDAAEAMLVVGSSLMVWSGYRFAERAARAGKPVAAVNLGRTRADALLAVKVEAPCEEALAFLLA